VDTIHDKTWLNDEITPYQGTKRLCVYKEIAER
jgi:hypothetical protein